MTVDDGRVGEIRILERWWDRLHHGQDPHPHYSDECLCGLSWPCPIQTLERDLADMRRQVEAWHSQYLNANAENKRLRQRLREAGIWNDNTPPQGEDATG